MSSVLTKAAILAADDLKMESIDVPEWGGAVIVRGMTGTDRDAFEEAVYKLRGPDGKQNLGNFRARLLALCLCDEGGARLFSDADVAALGAKSAAALSRCFDAAQKLNRFSANDVEDLTKNSVGDQSAVSTSA